jgi:hypothetical protein
VSAPLLDTSLEFNRFTAHDFPGGNVRGGLGRGGVGRSELGLYLMRHL